MAYEGYRSRIGNLNGLESVCDSFAFFVLVLLFSIDNRRRRARLNQAYRNCALNTQHSHNRQESWWFNAMHTPNCVLWAIFNIFHFVFLGIHKSQAHFRFLFKTNYRFQWSHLYLQSIVFAIDEMNFQNKYETVQGESSTLSGF